jgi:hypothetical protein
MTLPEHITGPIREFAIRTEREFTRLALALQEEHLRIAEQAATIKLLEAENDRLRRENASLRAGDGQA